MLVYNIVVTLRFSILLSKRGLSEYAPKLLKPGT